MDCDVLTLSGLWNSGPTHWQTHLEHKHPKFVRVPHRDYNNPVRDEWVAELDAAIAAAEGPPILVAQLRRAGALLVAPSDVEASSYPVEPNGFAPIPLEPLPFPSIVVASANDPYVGIERARQFAKAWGSKLVEIGDAGHINGESGYGDWPQCEELLAELCALAPQD
jgi:predicted alpha/beta hydrolase family esterase